MTTQHTPGRLKLFTVYAIPELHTQDGVFVACTSHPDGEADARRMVAAWNACLEIPTELLENLADDEATIAPIYRDLLVQRDALLEALKLAHGALYQAAADLNDWGCYAPAHFQTKHRLADDVQAYVNAAESVRVAITRAEGKQ